MKYATKPVEVEAITFEELVEYGRAHDANIINGMPWSFQYNGHPVTHENDECYLVTTLSGTLRMTPETMLVIGVEGELSVPLLSMFALTYEAKP